MAEHVPAHCPFYCDEQCQRSSILIDMGAAGALSLLTIIISLVNCYLHMCHFNNPYFQSKIISKCLATTAQSSCSWRPSTASLPCPPLSGL